MSRSPNAIDMIVAANLRAARKSSGVSQEQLAAHLGKTFQQVQKYERGQNRMTAGVLWQCADFLDVGIGYFYEGVPGGGTEQTNPVFKTVVDFLGTTGGGAVASAYMKLSSEVRTAIRNLVETLAKGTEQ